MKSAHNDDIDDDDATLLTQCSRIRLLYDTASGAIHPINTCAGPADNTKSYTKSTPDSHSKATCSAAKGLAATMHYAVAAPCFRRVASCSDTHKCHLLCGDPAVRRSWVAPRPPAQSAELMRDMRKVTVTVTVMPAARTNATSTASSACPKHTQRSTQSKNGSLQTCSNARVSKPARAQNFLVTQ